MESPVYAPAHVLPLLANYVKRLALATMAEPSTRSLGASRLCAARKELALGQQDVVAKEARLQEAEERIRREHAKMARDLTQAQRRIRELEKELKEKNALITQLQSKSAFPAI